MSSGAGSFTLREDELIQIPLESLIPDLPINFDLYASVRRGPSKVPVGGEIILFASAPMSWSQSEADALKKFGFGSFYIKSSDANRYRSYVASKTLSRTIPQNSTPEFKISQIQDIGSHLMEVCFHTGINPLSFSRLQNVAEDIVQCLAENPQAVVHIQSLVDHDMYTYFHSTGVGILAVAIAKVLGESRQDVLRDFALGGLLHDIGKRHIPWHVLNKKGPLMEEEWVMMKRHPELGTQDIQNLDVSNMIRDIVHFHHEKRDGSGYPHQIAGNDIPAAAQLVTIADIFNALTTTRSYHTKRSRFDALMYMKHHLQGQLWEEGFKALVSALTQNDPAVAQEAQAIGF